MQLKGAGFPAPFRLALPRSAEERGEAQHAGDESVCMNRRLAFASNSHQAREVDRAEVRGADEEDSDERQPLGPRHRRPGIADDPLSVGLGGRDSHCELTRRTARIAP
jgi:hypothetical protein